MRHAVRVTVSVFGLVTGFSAIQHGYYELIQGHVRPVSLMINSYGPPCRPDAVWHGCEPAMTVIPDFFWTGILSIMIGLIVMVWAGAFVQRKYGGVVLALLSVVQLLFGGGVIPPLMGVAAGLVGTRISAPVAPDAGPVSRLLARLWPWSLGAFVLWMYGMYPLGYFWGNWLMANGYLILVLIPGLMLLSSLSAFARDKTRAL
ncbi:MAG TPA: hypothetical protein VNT75_15940 [Symbiobacteriaceae bacterium]|nr:hypothetical protein [Symbiobacteriaceae bacterium]